MVCRVYLDAKPLGQNQPCKLTLILVKKHTKTLHIPYTRMIKNKIFKQGIGIAEKSLEILLGW